MKVSQGSTSSAPSRGGIITFPKVLLGERLRRGSVNYLSV